MFAALRSRIPSTVRARLRRWRGRAGAKRAQHDRRAGSSASAGGPTGLAPSPAPHGTLALTDPFFDSFRRFYASSETSPHRWRLNLRHEAIVGWQPEIFTGARVLDIASHDGRWSLAALEAGAASVTGIEAKPDLVDRAMENLSGYGYDRSRFSFVAGDVFEVLARQRFEVDVVLCLGFFYHTLRHYELLARIQETGARHVVLDTEVHTAKGSLIRVGTERVERQGNAVADGFSPLDTVLTGRPTVPAIRMMARGVGLHVDSSADWAGLLRDNPGHRHVGDYAVGRRVTLHLSRSAALEQSVTTLAADETANVDQPGA